MQLFKERLAIHLRGYRQFFRKNVDWVAWIYVLIPGVALTYYLLRETVFKLEYGILADLNSYVLVALLLFGSSMLKSRIFIEQADRLFLIQHNAFKTLKRCGYWYSFCLNIVFMALGYSLLFPLFYVIQKFSVLQMVLLAVGMIASYVICDVLDLWQRNWLKMLAQLLVIILLTVSVRISSLWLLCFIVFVIVLTFSNIERKLIGQHRYYHQQLELDLSRGGRFYTLIFQVNRDMNVARIHYFNRKAPKLFTKPYAKNKEATLVELMLKSIWRNKSYVRLLLQLIVILMPLIMMLPLWVSILLIIFGYFGIQAFIGSIALEAKESSFFKLICYRDEDWFIAIQKTKRIIVWPVVSLYIVIVVVRVFVVG